ncbi:unnamed protein product [Amoebophrya sp. A120]|nr:unnamed protein product [Amoebophrya sp. A120]|eukprot:GSA120T00004750001.1
MDPAMIDQLSPKDRQLVLAQMNDMQVAESMNTYNNLVERCFGECVNTFRSKALDDAEEGCAKRCVQKFMSYSQRVAQRFAEKNAAVAGLK